MRTEKRTHFIAISAFFLLLLSLFLSNRVFGYADSGDFENAASGASVISEEGPEEPCAITKQPEDRACAAGDIVSFRVEAAGNVIRYQWQTSEDGGDTWGDARLSGSTTGTLSLEAKESRNNYRFRCIVSWENGTSLTSDAATLSVLRDLELVDKMNLQMSFCDKSDMMWSYHLSMSPVAVSYKGAHDRLYWGYTTCDGFAGVASFDFDTGEIVKTHLKQSVADDHSNTSVFIKDGYLIASYSEGHNQGKTMNYRISSEPESAESFGEVFQFASDGLTCYGQFFEYNDAVFSFYRYNNNNWRCLSSADDGLTWGDEKRIIEAPFQYYCKFQETTTPGLLRLCMYSNPAGGDPSIRMGFLDLNTGLIYNSDAETVLGDWSVGIYYGRFDRILVPERTQRLFDVAVTGPDDISVLVGQFPDKQADTAVYCWYHNGELYDICDAGESLLHYSYLNGMAFYGADRVVLSRSDKLDVPNGRDYIEIWSLGEKPALEKTIYSEEKQGIPIRNLRPIVDSGQRAVLWLRGYYDPNSYTSFDTDAMIYLIEEDRIV